MNLFQFEAQKVKIVDCDGIVYYGQVLLVQTPDDNDQHEIMLDIETKDGTIYGLYAHEIKSIELVD